MASQQLAAMTCPFCGFRALEYGMLLHMEEIHPESGDSPFVPRGGEAARAPQPLFEDQIQYVECPIDDCDEFLAVEEMDAHLQIHYQVDEADDLDSVEERQSTPEPVCPPAPDRREAVKAHRRRQGRLSTGDRHHDSGSRVMKNATAIRRWAEIFMPKKQPSSKSRREKSQRAPEARNDNSKHKGPSPSSVRGPPSSTRGMRLGKKELGKYHDEKQMPNWLKAHLTKNWGRRQGGVIPVLAQFLAHSPDTKCAYLCDPATEHVSRLKTEGSFCGYRNIQTMVSYIVNARYPGYKAFKGRLPSIFEIQDIVEAAWDRGINSVSRIETGGIRGTRKFIGTPEAQALLLQLGIGCEAVAFKNSPNAEDNVNDSAEARMKRHVEEYYEQGIFNPVLKVRETRLPPIYLQHHGHSITIIGIQRTVDDQLHLLVFDPVFGDTHAITRNIGRDFKPRFPDTMLKPYRRGHNYLGRFESFELLKLSPQRSAPPPFPTLTPCGCSPSSLICLCDQEIKT